MVIDFLPIKFHVCMSELLQIMRESYEGSKPLEIIKFHLNQFSQTVN